MLSLHVPKFLPLKKTSAIAMSPYVDADLISKKAPAKFALDKPTNIR